jgi:hypothetical protein
MKAREPFLAGVWRTRLDVSGTNTRRGSPINSTAARGEKS